ncbi:MAG: hypothetical protein AABW59_03095 [archaeon]
MFELIALLLLALFLTIILELFVAYFLGHKSKKMFFLVVLVNFITNPLLNAVMLAVALVARNFYWPVAAVLEIVVVFAEALMLSKFARKDFGEMLKLSFSMNLASFVFGLVFFTISGV